MLYCDKGGTGAKGPPKSDEIVEFAIVKGV
jgi:hypothetical protein